MRILTLKQVANESVIMDCYSSSSCRVNLDGNGLLIIDAQRSGGDRVDALLMERKRLSEETLRTEMLMQRGNSTGRIKARDTEAQTETETQRQRHREGRLTRSAHSSGVKVEKNIGACGGREAYSVQRSLKRRRVGRWSCVG